MKLRIFDMETDVVFSDQYVNVIEIENRAYYRELVARFNQVFDGWETEKPFTIIGNTSEKLGKNDFLLINNAFMLEYVTKAISTKVQKYLTDEISNQQEGKELLKAIQEIKIKFEDILVDFNLDIEYNDNVSLSDFVKLFTPKVNFVDYEDITNTYKKLIKVISTLGLYKFLVLIDLRGYLDNNQIVEIYKEAKMAGINLLVIENKPELLLKYENKILIDIDLFELNSY